MTLVDSPVEFDEVNIVVTKVDVHATGSDSLSGWFTVNETPATYDLLELCNGASVIFADTMLPAGKYTQIRLAIGEGSNVVIDSVSYDLEVSSATGLKLNHNFEIAEGALYELTLDFDAAKSIKKTGNDRYKLHPVIRVVANVISGSISGIISPASVMSLVSTVVNSDTVSTFSDTTSGAFKLMALPAGTYDVSIMPTDTTYLDTTITGVAVVAQQDTDLGTIVLTAKP